MGKRLSGASTADEDRELDELFKSDPDAWFSYEVMRATEVKDPIPDAIVEEIHSMLEVSGPTADVIPFYRKSLVRWSAVACVAAVVCWFVFARTSRLSGSNEIVAQNGTSTEVTLPDGTTVKLNAGSRLSYARDFVSRPTREVTLTGEAYFTVIHDERHPFIIHTADISIIDLGTIFNVRAYPDDHLTETTLIDGSVEVLLRKGESPGKIVLKPNEKLLYNANGSTDKSGNQTGTFEISAVTPAHGTKNEFVETAWIDNKMVFRNERFGDLARRMERRYNLEIAFSDEELKSVHLTGTISNETVDEAMKLLQATTSFKYTIAEGKLTLGLY
ncbi:FecR family protein [Hufsiella ginkgonis]|uniref:DUF4974 domain-containing protein n=1 Tax=Hufsiella ginkgonis TaxID=2695274 RepID=A0A7K1XS42_9SPHI|nr:FecR domain-containing protein [Hufsiella ginkgonis]MXV13770.1 DUF4974 domain-containing protein [Hufsiella ginkgonis]